MFSKIWKSLPISKTEINIDYDKSFEIFEKEIRNDPIAVETLKRLADK